MKLKKAVWISIFIITGLLLLSFNACTSQDSFKDQTITAENKAEIAAQAATELTVEEARLLKEYLERSYPDLAENDLPLGRNLAQMIEEEKVVEATSPSQVEPAEEADGGTTEPPAAAKNAESAPSAQAPAPREARAETPPPAKRTVETPPAADTAASTGTSIPEVPEVTAEPPAEIADNTMQQADAADAIPEEVVPELPSTVTVDVPSGTTLDVRLIEELSTETAVPGDWFETELAKDLLVDDHLIATKGDRVRGRVVESQGAGKVKGLATMAISITDLYVEGERFPLQAETLTFQAEKTTGKDAAKVGVASGIGAILGAIIGGKKGAVIGAGVGAGAGTTTVLATKGDEIVFDVEQIFRFRLNQGFPVEILAEQ